MARTAKARKSKPRSSEVEELRRRLQEAEQTLEAIRNGEVDALVVSSQQGEQVFTLKDADRPYRRLIEQMREGALALDADGVIFFSNACFADMLEADLERLLGDPFSRWVMAEEQAAWTQLLKQGRKGSAKGEIRLCSSSGEVIPVELSLNRLESDAGPALLTAIVLDLRERKRSVESLRATLEELDTKVADLEIANKKLRQTNEELASVRQGLETERQRYLDLFESAPDGYLVTDPKGIVLEANRAATVQLNVSAPHLVKTPLVLFVDLHDRRIFLAESARFFSTQQNRLDTAEITVTMQPRDREPFIATLKIAAMRGSKGELRGLRWLIRDATNPVRAERQVRQLNAELELRVVERTAELETTNLFLASEIEERKQAEKETLARNRELSVLYAVSQAATGSLDLEAMNRVLQVTLNALEMEAGGVYLLEPDGETLTLRVSRGHSPEFLAGVSSQKIGEGVSGRAAAEKKPFVSDISDYPTSYLAPIVAREGMQTIAALPILWRDQVIGVMNLSSRRPRSLSPEELKLLAAIGHSLGNWVRNARLYEEMQSELAERRRAEETVRQLNRNLERRAVELEIANRELESFSYSVSHDLRAPLATIDGFSRLLAAEYAGHLPEQGQHFLELIQGNAATMQRLINDLLSFSRSARQPLRKHAIGPREIAAQALEELRGTFDGKQVEVILGDLPVCEADPALLKQVFVNLLSNAIKFTRKRAAARIEIAAEPCEDPSAAGDDEPCGGSVAYYVRDNGVGFNPENAERLFGVFQRLHSEDEYEGTGVGLAIVERIIRRHGGRVWAEAAVDQGATFYFTLP